MTKLVLALALSIAGAAVAQEDLSPKQRAAVAPVLDALDAAVAADGVLPPTASVREKLERLGRLDQAGRRMIPKINSSGLTPEETRAAMRFMGDRMEAIDRANHAELLKLIPAEGWFSISIYGEQAADAAFHIIQHGDAATMKRVLPAIEAMAAKGEADGGDVMAMSDRIALDEGRPQRYGTQFHCVNGRMQPYPLENPAKVEDWRAAMKAPFTYAEYITRFLPNAQKIPCGD